MGIITVRDLGKVRIEGDTPTPEESRRIAALVNQKRERAERKGLPGIIDDTEIPEGNERTAAIEEYLASPGFRRLALEILGGVAGAATGGTFFAAQAALRPALSLLYRSIGAGVGEGAAAGISQIFDPRESVAKEVLRGFATGATAESIGAAIPAIIKRIRLKGIEYTDEGRKADRLLRTIKEGKTKEAFKEAQKNGFTGSFEDFVKQPVGLSKTDRIIREGQITPGLGSENRAIDIVENISEKALFAGGRIIRARKGAETGLTNELKGFVDNFSNVTTREDAGELALDAIQNSLDYFRVNAKKRYDKLAEAARVPVLDELGRTVVVKKGEVLTKPISVDVTESKKLAEQLLQETKPTRRLAPGARDVLLTVKELDNTVSFSTANNVRSELLGVSRSFTDAIKGKSAYNAGKMVKSITNDIDKTVDAVPTDLRKLYDEAQTFYKQGVEKYNKKIIRNLAEKTPEEVYQTLIKPNRPTTIKTLMDILKETKDKEIRGELIDSIKGTMIGDIVNKSQLTKKKIDANYIQKEFGKFGKSVLNQIFEPREIRRLDNLLEGLQVAQQKSVGEGIPGAIFIQLTQAGMAIGLLQGNFTTEAGIVLLGPIGIARMLTNPRIVNLLRKGFQLNPGSKKAYTNAAQIIGAMVSNNIISEDEADDYLENMKSTLPKGEQKLEPQSFIFNEPFSIGDDIGLTEEERQPRQLATQPTLPTPNLTTPNVNPTLLTQAPTGIATLNQGLTPTESAFLREEDKQIRLRQRGLA